LQSTEQFWVVTDKGKTLDFYNRSRAKEHGIKLFLQDVNNTTEDLEKIEQETGCR